jgi:hypothetical protein
LSSRRETKRGRDLERRNGLADGSAARNRDRRPRGDRLSGRGGAAEPIPDRQRREAAAAAAGLPASQVTTSFATAWADTLSGQYLVFAVGGPAVAALYFDVCGWSNPSALPAGSTPFYYYAGEQNTLPGADAFIDAASDTARTRRLLPISPTTHSTARCPRGSRRCR